jgi:pimeloyl-ACP methyl ester carboxylesterase
VWKFTSIKLFCIEITTDYGHRVCWTPWYWKHCLFLTIMFVLSPSSWHEIGMYDLPAMVDYVLRVTGDPDLHFVGHSMGATTAVVMLSERPEYNSKLKITLLLAPVVKLEHNTSIFRHSAPLWKALQVSGTDCYIHVSLRAEVNLSVTLVGRLQRPRGLRLVMYSTTRTLLPWVPIPFAVCMHVYDLSCRASGLATGRYRFT